MAPSLLRTTSGVPTLEHHRRASKLTAPTVPIPTTTRRGGSILEYRRIRRSGPTPSLQFEVPPLDHHLGAEAVDDGHLGPVALGVDLGPALGILGRVDCVDRRATRRSPEGQGTGRYCPLLSWEVTLLWPCPRPGATGAGALLILCAQSTGDWPDRPLHLGTIWVFPTGTFGRVDKSWVVAQADW